MRIKDVADTSYARALRWHKAGISEWSALEWAGAMAGEAGEACNAAKKLRRLELKIPSMNEGDRHYRDMESAKLAIAHEACDTILYALLLMNRVGLTGAQIERAIANVFNVKSQEYGFPERIGEPYSSVMEGSR